MLRGTMCEYLEDLHNVQKQYFENESRILL